MGTQIRGNPEVTRDSSWANAPLEQKAADGLKAHRDGGEGERRKETLSLRGSAAPDQEGISPKLLYSILDLW